MWLALYCRLYICALSEVQVFMMTWVRMQQNQDVEGTSTFRLDKLITGEELRSVLMTGFCLDPGIF